MRFHALTLLAFLVAIAARPLEATAAGSVSRYAIVVGNNRPDDAQKPQLRFADDDAVAIYRLLEQAGVHSTLLARLDGDTAVLNQDIHPTAPPTWRALARAARAIAGQIRAESGRGRETEFYFVYSGHGDVAHGEGYVVLEDRRLTRTMLFQELLTRSPADRKHVLIDACKSYYLAFDKGPGGKRERYDHGFATHAIPAELDDTGFVLSTSSDRDSHEWDRFQAGIFSHEVRSGLRGGADADLDGQVSYGELGAFLATANRAIENPRFRPDFVVRPPRKSARGLREPILSWGHVRPAIEVDTAALGHFYVESVRGERLADLHPAAGQLLRLYLPPERPLFVNPVDEDTDIEIDSSRVAKLSELGPRQRRVARRGAIHLAFAKLFDEPFSAVDVAAFARRFELQRLDPLETEAHVAVGTDRHPLRTALGWTAIAGASVAVAASAWAYGLHRGGMDASHEERAARNDDIRTLGAVALVSGGLAVLAGTGWLTLSRADRRRPKPTRLALEPRATPGGVVLSVAGWW